MDKLYRGVSKIDDERNNDKIFPKGDAKKVTMRYGDHGVRHDGKFTHGSSITNTARSHQINSGMHNGCGVSTTRDKKIAEYFATSGGIEGGFVYIISEIKLADYGILQYEFVDAENSHEKEVTLIMGNSESLPNEVIMEKYEISVSK